MTQPPERGDLPRRQFLARLAQTTGAAATLSVFPPAIQRALAIPADRRSGTLQDVDHIVILMQENRSFDHYFGSLCGVRGFADRFPIPVAPPAGLSKRSVWLQPNAAVGATPARIAPFHLNTQQQFEVMRVEGTPHSWTNAQHAWDNGRMNRWPAAKENHSMGYFGRADLPFQWALANAFTICDAYHCSFQGGTNTNRLFHWTGTNDPSGRGNGPATYNDYDWFDADHGDGGYTWTTYPERLQAAGISWQVYENMEDNFTDNPLAGFQSYRAAWRQDPGYSTALRERGISTRDLDQLKEDVLAHRLPQVSWIVATAEGSEHPGPSSPAQGADYTAQVLDALTADPAVWARTVLFINFDENDGFFDHVPPPAAPSVLRWHADPSRRVLAGASTVDPSAEYHRVILPYHDDDEERALRYRAYGLGPRVPMYVVSPWSKGGWVDSQTFDHTSVLRFIERRFGVREPQIGAWRRAVCGDLTSAFNFADPDDRAFFARLPQTEALADRARALPGRTTPATPETVQLPVQERGTRPSRALPYVLHVDARHVPCPSRAGKVDVELNFQNEGEAAAVFHVYDRHALQDVPRRYTVEPGRHLRGVWSPMDDGHYDLWVLGPNGFHRHLLGYSQGPLDGTGPRPEVQVRYDAPQESLVIDLVNAGDTAVTFVLEPNAYLPATAGTRQAVPARSRSRVVRSLQSTGRWYDFTVTAIGRGGWARRFAGRLENGQPSISDPAMSGPAVVLPYNPPWR